ncbi:UNVERIFIED_CONTAM: hypothetical protein FKN15_032180 [Acipenser sinensis]
MIFLCFTQVSGRGDGRGSLLEGFDFCGEGAGVQHTIPGDIAYASGTYRFFKLPKSRTNKKAVMTYRGTIPDYAEQLDFDALHVFKKGEAVSVDAEMAAVLQCSRFAPHFTVQSSDNTSASEGETQQVRVYFMASLSYHRSPLLQIIQSR